MLDLRGNLFDLSLDELTDIVAKSERELEETRRRSDENYKKAMTEWDKVMLEINAAMQSGDFTAALAESQAYNETIKKIYGIK